MITTPGRRLERQILGNRAWGTFRNAGPAHGHWIRELTVYPPGITTGERWAVGLDRQAPVVGAIIGLALTLLTFDLLPRWTMLILIFTPSLGITVLAHRLTSRIRRQVRSIVVAEDYRTHPSTINGDAALFDGCYSALTRLDAEAALLSPVEYERRWGEIYQRIPPAADKYGPAR